MRHVGGNSRLFPQWKASLPIAALHIMRPGIGDFTFFDCGGDVGIIQCVEILVDGRLRGKTAFEETTSTVMYAGGSSGRPRDATAYVRILLKIPAFVHLDGRQR